MTITKFCKQFDKCNAQMQYVFNNEFQWLTEQLGTICAVYKITCQLPYVNKQMFENLASCLDLGDEVTQFIDKDHISILFKV